MAKLHEILAVENGKETLFKNTLPEMVTLFKSKTDHFWGGQRTLELFGEETVEKRRQEEAESESKELVTTVPSELEYLGKIVVDYIDVMFQKDEANQRATADLIVNGKVLATSVPATTLLGLENKLKGLRPVFEAIPTLQPGPKWEKAEDLGPGIYHDANPEIRTKTAKSFDFKVLVPATEHHPAQIEKWTVDTPIGVYTKNRWCSMMSTLDKSNLLARYDDMMEAIKQARCRANDVDVSTARIGKQVIEWLVTGAK